MTAAAADRVAGVFSAAGCEGTLCVRALAPAAAGGRDRDQAPSEVVLGADTPVVPASVIKLPIALEAESAFAEGRLDPRERVELGPAERVPDSTGLSLFTDPAVVSLRDLVVLMLTISDGTAADALLRRVGTDAVNARLAGLGLDATLVAADIRTTIDRIGQDFGHSGWADLVAWSATATPEENAAVDALLPSAWSLDPASGNRTTARDMVRLLDLVWRDAAGPPDACARVRALLGQQLTRHRLASGFRTPVRVAAKSGGLAGVVRNEVGVISHPDGRRYAAAVFTRTPPGADDPAVNAAIGRAAAVAVAELRERGR